ncbi:hypothetical protein PGIGA_G00030580 [Pangasianodon gigas]|uniref:Uncharacterized protein n=1 Tax=Pangasianodon gigas TaxID=30993 RepID=A0ACC5WY01_PANGG|nr:hypothetical protein [Pangasianodon gigas]
MVVRFLRTCGALTLILPTLLLSSAAPLEPYDLLYSSAVEAFQRGDYVNVVRAACLNNCLERKLGPLSMHKVSADVDQDFHRRIPYHYLQLAYLKLKQLDKAAAAAHTYFQANPEHIEINLEHYKALHGMEEKHFIDREARPHQASDI